MSARALRAALGRRVALPGEPVDHLAVLVLAAFALVQFRDPILTGNTFFGRDIHLMWYTQVEAFVRAIRAGSWPVWNPYLSFGQPLWADANTQVLYPFTWAHLVMRPWNQYKLLVLVHSCLAGAGMYALLRHYLVDRGSALLCALGWMACGPLVSVTEMWNLLVGAAWLPWAALAAERTLATASARWAGALGGVIAVQVHGGSPEMALASFAVAALLAVCAWQETPTATSPTRLVRLGAIALVAAAVLSAAQWVPAIESALDSARVNLPREVRTYWSVHPLNLLQLLVPIPFDSLDLRAEQRTALFDGREAFLRSLHLGLPSILLLAAAVASSRIPRRLAYVAAAGGSILLALGKHSPVYDAASWLFPPFGMVRYPAKAMVPAAFAWFVLAGLGTRAWVLSSEAGFPRRAGRAALAVAVAVAGACAVAAGMSQDGRIARWLLAPDLGVPDGVLRTVILSFLLGSVLLAALLLAARRSPLTAARAAMMFAVIDLLQGGTKTYDTAPATLFQTQPPLVAAVAPREQRRIYVYDYYVYGKSQRYLGRARPYTVVRGPRGWSPAAATALGLRHYLFPPSGGVWGREGSYDHDVTGLFTLPLSQLGDLLRLSEGTPTHLRLLQMGAVESVVSLHSAGLEDLPLESTHESPFPEAIQVRRVPDPLPRTYVVGAARAADGARALELVQDPEFDPRREILLPQLPPGASTRAASGTARIVDSQPDRVTIEAELTDAGYVVLVDAWGPQWRATVDGRSVDVVRANIAFRAVAVPAGRHQVEMRFSTRSLKWALVVAALGWITLGACSAARGVAPPLRGGTALRA